MRKFWRMITGSSASGNPSRDHASRPRTRRPLEVMDLEGRQLMAIFMGALKIDTGFVVPHPAAGEPTTAPILFPSDGRYAPVTVTGVLNQRYTTNLVGSFAVSPHPVILAQSLAQELTPAIAKQVIKTDLANPNYLKDLQLSAFVDPAPQLDPLPVQLPGYAWPVDVTPVLKTPFPNDQNVYDPANDAFYAGLTDLKNYTFTLTPTLPPYESLVIANRLEARPVVSSALLQVTDQYRQDEPRAVSTLRLDNNVDPSKNTLSPPKPFGATYTYLSQSTLDLSPRKVKTPSITQGLDVSVEVPTSVYYSNNYSFTFHVHLQALKHPGTSGRQYILNVSAEDLDDGGAANAAVIVPADDPIVRH